LINDEILLAQYENGELAKQTDVYERVKEADERRKAAEARDVDKNTNQISHEMSRRFEEKYKGNKAPQVSYPLLT
jgi:hypothetical protein